MARFILEYDRFHWAGVQVEVHPGVVSCERSPYVEDRVSIGLSLDSHGLHEVIAGLSHDLCGVSRVLMVDGLGVVLVVLSGLAERLIH